MDIILWIIIGILLIATIILSVCQIVRKRQISLLRKQLHFIETKETNLLLTTQYHFDETDAFVEDINRILSRHREITIRMNRLNNNFKETITSISHDIRTPLTSAIGYLQMLEQPDLSITKRHEYFTIIQNRILAVQRMLDQLFEYARIESGELQLQAEPVNLNNVLRDTLGMFYNDFVSKGTEPRIEIPEDAYTITGDKAALKRVFENIINNALVHGKTNYSIISYKKENHYCVEFANQTDTIDEDDIDRIFERFFTTDRSRTKKSTGLGLAISKNLIEIMGGRITASLVDQVFCITICF